MKTTSFQHASFLSLKGLTGFGISLLGAVGGIAHHPLQCLVQDGASPRSLVAGVGLGLVGMFTKPLSGAADLVALTGQGKKLKPRLYFLLLIFFCKVYCKEQVGTHYQNPE